MIMTGDLLNHRHTTPLPSTGQHPLHLVLTIHHLSGEVLVLPYMTHATHQNPLPVTWSAQMSNIIQTQDSLWSLQDLLLLLTCFLPTFLLGLATALPFLPAFSVQEEPPPPALAW